MILATEGSTHKPWDRDELVRCRAIETGQAFRLDLRGEIHPIFRGWLVRRPEHDDLLGELHQPLLLASRILEAVGYPWLATFFAGRTRRRPSGGGGEDGQETSSIAAARRELRATLPGCMRWQLDPDMFHGKGWVGYTVRHPRPGSGLEHLDSPRAIRRWDRLTRLAGGRYRSLTAMVAREYPARLRKLRRRGRAGAEEYALTAFMATVTLLHELGHIAFWKDLTRAPESREPYHGSDLEMELGDSFVSHAFGGWVPVPVADEAQFRRRLTFGAGLAWRQHLSLDHHGARPLYRAHYSVPAA